MTTVLKSGALLGTQTLTGASGTYTPTAGTRKIILEGVASGGGGAGALGSITDSSFGSGGASGAYFRKFIDPGALITGGAYTIGAAGPGGDGTPNDGTAGVDATIVVQGVTYTLKGGPGGKKEAHALALTFTLGGATLAGTTAGDQVRDPEPGGYAFSTTVQSAGISGRGGSSPWGSGGAPLAAEGTGNAGTGDGSGGGGAASTSATGKTGGAGTAGKFTIYEYA